MSSPPEQTGDRCPVGGGPHTPGHWIESGPDTEILTCTRCQQTLSTRQKQ